MDTIFKTFRAELKEPDEDGSLNMLIPVSTNSIDRDGEVIEPSAFKKTIPKFMKHPVLVASHDYRDLQNQIGEWSKLKVTENGIEGKPKYYIGMGNDQADWAYKLAQKGVAAFSVGFIPKEWEDGDGEKSARRTYKEVELLEISQVIIPSNREAIMGMRSKGVDPVVEKILVEVEKELPSTITISSPLATTSICENTTTTTYIDSNVLKLPDNLLVTKPEETDNFIRIPVNTADHTGHRIRTIQISEKEGVEALYCGTDKVIMTYLFRKDHEWTMEKAKKWVKDHEKAFEVEHQVSQEEIIDEIDYLNTLIEKEGLSDKAKVSFKELIKRLPADDIAVEKNIEVKPVEKVELKVPTEQEILDEIKNINWR